MVVLFYSKGVLIIGANLQKLRSACPCPHGTGAFVTLKKHVFPLHVLPCQFVRFKSNSTSVIAKSCLQKFDPLASRLPRSLTITGTDTDRSVFRDFLLTLHSNHGPISYRFWDKRRFQSKIEKKKFQPRVFIAQLRRFHLEYWMASKNYNHGATWQREKDSFAYIIAEYGERTDGQTLQTNS